MSRHPRSRPGSAVRRGRRLAALVTLAGGALVVTAPAASAHSVLVASNPAAGATVTKALTAVTLTFNENVRSPAYVVVTGPNGTRIDEGSPQILDATVSEPLKAAATAGTYTIAFRVVSADGHPVEDEIRYTLAASGATARQPAPNPTAAAGATGDGGHLLHVLAGFAVVLAGAGALIYERLHRGSDEEAHADQ